VAAKTTAPLHELNMSSPYWAQLSLFHEENKTTMEHMPRQLQLRQGIEDMGG